MSHTSTASHHDLRRASRLVLSDYTPQLVAQSFALSSKGERQPVNQDNYLAIDHFPPPHGRALSSHPRTPSANAPGDSFFIVADGQGEARSGSRASTLAVGVIEEFVRYIREYFQRRRLVASRRQILNALRVAFDRADQFIWNEAEEESSRRGMGAEATATCSYRGNLFVANAGASQAFLWRAGQLHRLTRLSVQEPACRYPGAGRGFTDAPATSDRKTPILGGCRAGVHVLLRMLDLEPNDYLLLCTRGLTEHVRDHIIRSTLSANPDPHKACESLLKEADKQSRQEDLTVIVARFALAHE